MSQILDLKNADFFAMSQAGFARRCCLQSSFELDKTTVDRKAVFIRQEIVSIIKACFCSYSCPVKMAPSYKE